MPSPLTGPPVERARAPALAPSMLSTMALMAPQQPTPPSEHERELVLGIEQGIEQGKKAAEHDKHKVYE